MSHKPWRGSIRKRASRARGRSLSYASALLVLFGFLLSGATGAGAYFAPALVAGVRATGQTADLVPSPSPGARSTPTPAPAAAPGAPFTVLLLGSDDDQKFTGTPLTQSMILVRVDPQTRQVSMLSIPRDLYVPITCAGYQKIDVAYSYGGPSCAIRTVEENFHVRIDEYVWIGLKGLIKLIDMLGGVDLVTSHPVMDDFYPNDINSSNPYGYQRVAVLPGSQHLDGTHALEYVRSRHGDIAEDFGRSQRQQQVLLALREKARTLNPADIPDLAATFNGELKTSMGLQRIRELLPIAAQIQVQDVKQIVLTPPYTGSAQLPDGADIVTPNWGLILPLVRQNFPA